MAYIICNLFIYPIEAVILWQYAANLSAERRLSRKISLVILSAGYIVLYAFSQLNIKWLNTSLYFIFNAVFLYFVFNIKSTAAVFHSAILTAIMCMTELIAYGGISYFHPDFFEETGYFYRLALFGIISKFLFFLIIRIVSYFMGNKREKSLKYNKSAIILGAIPLTTCFIMITFVNIGENKLLKSDTAGMLAISGVLLLFINLLAFSLNEYNQKKASDMMDIKLQLQKETDSAKYYSMLLETYENQNILIHDIKKHLQSIELLNEAGENEKISEYINGVLDSADLKEANRASDNDLLNAILSRYRRKADDAGISFHADVRTQTIDFVGNDDLTTIFCNILDNAMKSAGKEADGFIDLSVSKRDNTLFTVITLVNSCKTNPFPNENGGAFTIPKSDKEGHGFGLKSVSRAVKKYDGNMKLYFEADNNEFHTIITLKDKSI